jgi:hypothetical protein
MSIGALRHSGRRVSVQHAAMTGYGRTAALAIGVALVAGCATTTGTASAPEPVEEQRYTVNTTVLESPDHGPQLCLGPVELSLPPQCGGPDVIGFDWADVDDEESANGTTWGSYGLTGTWDGERFTLTERPGPHGSVPSEEGPPASAEFPTPCEAPDGGWADTDPARAGEQHWNAATNYATAQPDVAGIWLDRHAAMRNERPDPNDGVLNVSFTGDLAVHEAELRRLYGGPLCVSSAERPLAELQALQQKVHDELGRALFTSSADAIDGVVEITVTLVDDELVQRLQELDPEGLVRAYGMLRPVD